MVSLWFIGILKHYKNSKNIDEIYVATDCNEIKEVVNSFGLSKVKVYDREAQKCK